MRELKPGDRVAVYSSDHEAWKNWRVVGTVTQKSLATPDVFEVKSADGTCCYCHRKQLRKLVKKERRRVWVTFHGDGTVDSVTPFEPGVIEMQIYGDHFEFIEVRRK